MPPIPIVFRPGVDAQSTPALNSASWNESENVRFFQGLVQKSGGFRQYTEQVANAGRPSALRAWTTLAGIASLAIGSQDLVSLLYASAVANITPRTRTSIIPIAVSTTFESQQVIIQDAINTPQVGDWLFIQEPISVGGLILHGPYVVQVIIDSTHYRIDAAVAANFTLTNSGAARQFTTASGTSTVTVSLANHGLFSGEIVFIHDGVSVGGVTIRGNYIATVVDPNTYTITVADTATSTASVFEYGGNMALTFLTGLIQATSAAVDPYADSDPDLLQASGGQITEWAGVGSLTYAPGNLLTMFEGIGPRPVFLVNTTKAVSLVIANVGSGGTPGAHTFRGTSGSGTAFEFTANVAGDGTLTGAIPILTVNGSYTVNPALLNEPIVDVTDGTTVGATVHVGMWPNTLAVSNAGLMSTIPDNPAAVSNSGTGNGASVFVGWDYGYLIGSTLSLTGGSGESPTFLISTLIVVRVEIMDVGSGGTPGPATFRGTTGTGTLFEFTANVAGDGTLTGAVPVITVNGSYTVRPTIFDEPIVDLTAGLTGATVNISMWPGTVILGSGGHMTSIPDNPADTTDSSGGNGVQLYVTWDYSAGVQDPMGKEYIVLDNWGEFLVAIPAMSPVYVWQPSRGTSIALENVGSAPQANLGGFVASQQQILVVLGTINFASETFDPMLVRWSTVGDYTDFTPSSINQAGSLRLQLGSMIVAGTPVASRNLIWTDTALYAMQYQAGPFVFVIQPIGQNCGLIGPHAFGTMGDGTTLWMSQNQFYSVTAGGAPQPIPCSVWDFVFPGMDKADARQVACAVNSYYGEIAWYVPQADGTVTCARLQVQSGTWDYTVIEAGSTLDRAAWIDQNVFGPPFGADPEGNVYQQEVTRDADGEVLPTRLLSGMTLFSDGQEYFQVSHIYPDIKFDEKETHGPGTVNMRVWFYKDPQAPPRMKGPYPINSRTRRIPCRGRGKGLQFEFYTDDLGGFWRLGRVTVDAFPDGVGG